MLKQIALDTETTGLSYENGDRLIEIGLVEMVDRKFTGRTLHYYFNPERSVSSGAEAVHHLNDQFLADKPLFHTVIPELIAFIEGSELIIHNAKFDTGFINFELNKAGHPKTLENYATVTDTLMMARQKFPGQRNTLDALCKRFNVSLSSRENGHGALIDAQLLAKMYLAMTGGQMKISDASIYETVSSKNKKKEIIHTPILYADNSEIQQHQQFLQRVLTNALWNHEN